MFPERTTDIKITKLHPSTPLSTNKFLFTILKHGEEEVFSSMQETKARSKILNFLILPLKFSFALCLSPFYLKVHTSTDNGFKRKFVHAKSYFPQKILCAFLTILDFSWMFQYVRTSFPKDSKNPADHINMVIAVISQLFKCVMIKKLWLNQADFIKIGNFILNSDIPILLKKYLLRGGNNLIWFLLVMYTIIGISYIEFVSFF